MVVLKNDPFELVIKAFNELYPETSVEVLLTPMLDNIGCTTFTDGCIPVIEINVTIPYYYVLETLVHELAHVVIRNDETITEEDHGSEWVAVFDKIFSKYNEIGNDSYGEKFMLEVESQSEFGEGKEDEEDLEEFEVIQNSEDLQEEDEDSLPNDMKIMGFIDVKKNPISVDDFNNLLTELFESSGWKFFGLVQRQDEQLTEEELNEFFNELSK